MELKISDAISLKAFAKINLGLDVLKKRSDGYHDVRTVMQSVYLYDKVFIERSSLFGVTLAGNLKFLPSDGRNIAYRAASMLINEFKLKKGVHIKLHKAIPVSAGLGGGTSDAAAVLLGMNKLFGLGLSAEQLRQRGVKLGADVPFCLTRGTILAEGIGEKLTRLAPVSECIVLIAKPPFSVSTEKVYKALDFANMGERPDIDALIKKLKIGDIRSAGKVMGNVLESVTIAKHPIIQKIKDVMKEEGAFSAVMSGSGPAVFGIFPDWDAAKAAYKRVKKDMRIKQVYLTHTCGAKENIYI